jgi:hypothetical protein
MKLYLTLFFYFLMGPMNTWAQDHSELDKTNVEECVICLDEMTNPNEIIYTRDYFADCACPHAYHKKCLEESFLKIETKCPTCRAEKVKSDILIENLKNKLKLAQQEILAVLENKESYNEQSVYTQLLQQFQINELQIIQQLNKLTNSNCFTAISIQPKVKAVNSEGCCECLMQ